MLRNTALPRHPHVVSLALTHGVFLGAHDFFRTGNRSALFLSSRSHNLDGTTRLIIETILPWSFEVEWLAMTFYFVLSSTESSILDVNRPSASAIQAALASVQIPAAQWVGPRPRITRKSIMGALYSWLTTVTNVMAFEGPYSEQGAIDAARLAAQHVNAALARISNDWSPVTVTAYREAINGPLSWWQSGQASVTRTQNDFLTGLGRTAPDENPIGPDSPMARPPTIGEQINAASDVLGHAAGTVVGGVTQPLQKASSSIALIAVLGAAAVGTWVFWPEITMALGAARGGSRRRATRKSHT